MSDSKPLGSRAFCPHCGHKIEYLLPVDMMYDMQLVPMMIPASIASVKQYLQKHKDMFPRRYRRDRQHRLHRQITASEVVLIRKGLFRFKNFDGTKREPNEFGE